jgi:hypothetical protein
MTAGGPVRENFAAYSRAGDLLVQVADQRVIFACVSSGRLGAVAPLLGLGAFLDPHALLVVRRVWLDDRFGFEVPAFAALGSAQCPLAFGARGADGGEGVPARDEHLLGLPGFKVGAAELDGAHAPAVLDGQLADNITGQRHGQPLRSGARLCHSLSSSPGSPGSGRSAGSVVFQVVR